MNRIIKIFVRNKKRKYHKHEAATWDKKVNLGYCWCGSLIKPAKTVPHSYKRVKDYAIQVFN